METYLEALDIWEAVEEDYDVVLLFDNPTVAQIKSQKKSKSENQKQKRLRLLVFLQQFSRELWRLNQQKKFGIIYRKNIQEMKECEQDDQYESAGENRKREIRTYGNKRVCIYMCSVDLMPTYCISSMIYGSTGATHFDQLAKILTGYKINGARSSGIFNGILFIAVGSIFKITAVLYMLALDIYEGSPTPVTTFLCIAPKISISANISCVSIYGSYGATLQKIIFFYNIAFMILGALATIPQTKVKRFYYIRLVKRMFFDTPRTWILYEPMDHDKSLLLAMTSSFITSFFPYPYPLFSVTHQMELSSYL
ncbi:NADH-ubiquinone oxidoreductase chain 2-like [Capsicum annuum]|uniref:NADH-ubiquinone oxidoreductase chain 2-like n=1 Tax=Capsicum annuum TaxID=4072 RepID=UPI001FB097D8|nr:NADH-ubiquinone oxidoreductase chain 2-like [Capsicum annuum]